MLNIYINTWGNYNENGADLGEWITLPMDADELQEKLDEVAERMHDDDPEWFVNDYEWTGDIALFDVNEMDRYEDLNEIAQRLDNLDQWDCEALAAIVEVNGWNNGDALDILESGDFQFYADMDLTDVAEEIVNDCYFSKDTPDIFTRYFDYEAFGRDLSFDGYTETSKGVIYIG